MLEISSLEKAIKSKVNSLLNCKPQKIKFEINSI